MGAYAVAPYTPAAAIGDRRKLAKFWQINLGTL